MQEYDPKAIEEKWQTIWRQQNTYATADSSSLPKQYVLDMFPYPSGEGLHVGHPRGYIATDIYSRKKRMEGMNVLHPMGWDAFGLPAENYAIKNKIHPRSAVEKNVARFKEQLSLIGLDYDWSHEINTTDPEYYKWTQWIFLQMYKKGLAYQSWEPINWCPSCQTGLANEDVESDGTCERCGTRVEKKPMRQWVLKITEYADRLLTDLGQLSKWPEGVKEAQRNWIGRKEGIIISHTVEGMDVTLDAFSAYPAWLFADTFLVLAPEHPLVETLVKGTPLEMDVHAFVEDARQTPEIERGAEQKEKKGIFLGKYALDPINKGAKMPIWIANFAMMGFGTGIIRCSAHDPRDYTFAQKYNIPLKEVVERKGEDPVYAHENRGVLKDSGPFSGKEISPDLISLMKDWFVGEGYAQKTVTYRMKDWVFSRQRYWGEPIPIIHCETCGPVAVPESDLPVRLPEVEQYEPTGTGESPLASISEWVNTPCPACGKMGKRETNTMPQWAGSSWYYLRYFDAHNGTALTAKENEKYWMPVDVYVGGDHATRHLIYARFWHKFLFDIGVVSHEEPFPRLEFLGFILALDGRKMSKRWKNVINPDDVVHQHGADAFRLYEMFIGPFENTVPWSTDGIVGTRRFIERVARLGRKVVDHGIPEQENESVVPLLHRTVKKVTNDIENFKFNTAVSAMMIFMNDAEKNGLSRKSFAIFLKLLAPFAPHITEELWHELGEKDSIHKSAWPTFDVALTMDETVELPIQINGKLRTTLTVGLDATKDQVLIEALADPMIKKHVGDQEPTKIIYVPNKILNIVI